MNQYPFFEFEFLKNNQIAHLRFNRPEKRNAMNWDFFRDLPSIIDDISGHPTLRVCIISGNGKSFSAGLDLESFVWDFKDLIFSEKGESRRDLLKLIRNMQSGFLKILESPVIFISAIHKHCLGGALDFIAACDIRYASQDAVFSIRETKLGITADLGSLQLLPPIIGKGNTSELAFTSADINAKRAYEMGLLSGVFEDREKLMEQAEHTASMISSNPRISVQGTKEILNFEMSRGLREGMERSALQNAAFIDSEAFRTLVKKMHNKPHK